MNFLSKETIKKAIATVRSDKTRLQVGLAFMVGGLVLFGMYFPRTRVHTPTDVARQADGTGAAQVAGANTDTDGSSAAYPRTHAGAPEPGQHTANIPGSDPMACAANTSSGKSSAPTGLSGTIDVTILAGCTTASTYELKTTDGHSVQWAPLLGAFTFKDGSSYNQHGATAYAVTNLQFSPESYTGSSIHYGITAKPDANPGTYENALYVTDSAHKDGGYKIILRITVKK
jgi:hypothetical protein